VSAASSRPAHAGADTIIRGGKVITCDAGGSLAEALAVKDGMIMAVGRAAEITRLADEHTDIIDAAGRAVVPGLIDGHAHLDREGLKSVFPSLAGCASIDDILQRIKALVKEKAPGDWIVTMPVGDPPYYWDVPDNLAERRLPTRRELDRVAPDNPVYIRPIWGYWRHVLPISSVANTLALEQAALGPTMEPPPEVVEFETDPETGEFNGVIHENTFVPIVELGYFHMMPRFEHADRVQGLRDAMQAYNACGTTGVFEEHGCAQELIRAWQTVHDEGGMTMRARLMFSPSWLSMGESDPARVLGGWGAWLGGTGLGDDWLRVAGLYTEFGISADNRLRARAAPYTGWAGFNFDCGVPRARMRDFLVAAAEADIRISTIGIGYLDLFEEVDRIVPIRDRRWIIGHLNRVTPDQIARIRDLGLVMTAHTNRYIYKEGHRTRELIGGAAENTISPLRSLGEAGVHVALATDNVPTSLFYPVWQAVSRYNRVSHDAIAPDQALSRAEALRCATIEGAYLTFEEDIRGSIETGKFADVAVLSDHPLTCPEDAIKDIVGEITMVGGDIVYRREET